MFKKIYMLFAIVALSSCSKWIAPPYTNVERLSDIKMGMSFEQVNTLLGIEPYDVYYSNNQDFIVIYNYRVKERITSVSGSYNKKIHSDVYQTKGDELYRQKYYCYVYFSDKKVKSFFTDEGKLKSEDILIKNRNMYLIQKDKIGFYERNDSIVFVPVK